MQLSSCKGASLPPANEVCEGYVFIGVCHSVHGGGRAWLLRGACMVACGGCAWFLWGGVHGCSGGVCMVSLGGHAWLLWEGMRGCSGGCVVAPGGHVWLLPVGWHVWFLQGGGMRGFFDEIRSMSGRYASYWNAFLYYFFLLWRRRLICGNVTIITD